MQAAYFDVDGTLVGTNLLHPTVAYLATQADPADSLLRVVRLAADAPWLALAERKDRRLFNERLFLHFRGMTQDRLEVLADEIFERAVQPRIYPGAHDLVRRCRDAGFRTVLVTGSLDVTVRPLVRELGADDFIANRLEMKDGRATGRLLRPVVAGPAKARILVDDAREHGHDLAACQAYSDSASDVPMLSVVGHPFVVHPDARLERLAHAYDWPILNISGAPRRRRGLLGFLP